jgi:hypothetical protein
MVGGRCDIYFQPHTSCWPEYEGLRLEFQHAGDAENPSDTKCDDALEESENSRIGATLSG